MALRTNDQAKRISDKAQEVRDKNKGLAHLCNISRVLFDGAILQDPVLNPKKFTTEKLACFKWSPVTSCDVERSFSMLKALYHENRTPFTAESLSRHTLEHFNAQYLQRIVQDWYKYCSVFEK